MLEGGRAQILCNSETTWELEAWTLTETRANGIGSCHGMSLKSVEGNRPGKRPQESAKVAPVESECWAS